MKSVVGSSLLDSKKYARLTTSGSFDAAFATSVAVTYGSSSSFIFRLSSLTWRSLMLKPNMYSTIRMVTTLSAMVNILIICVILFFLYLLRFHLFALLNFTIFLDLCFRRVHFLFFGFTLLLTFFDFLRDDGVGFLDKFLHRSVWLFLL